MSAVLATILSILAQLSGAATTAGSVGQIIGMLVELLPIIEKEWTALYQPVINVIQILRGSGAATEAQKAQLDQMEKDADAKFDKAADAAEKEDAEADAAASTQK